MKNKLKLVFVLFVLLIFVGVNNIQTVNAAINSHYEENTEADESISLSVMSTLGTLVMPIVFNIFRTIEKVISQVMQMMTGKYFFPWADLIIFNAVPLLDINFINPSEGSLFMNFSGEFTLVGEVLRNVYFTLLSICLAFLGITVAINVIKMLFSSIASSKARYKEAIGDTLKTVVLIFAMHYLISFVFYINEQLVVVAGNVAQNIIGEETIIKAEKVIDYNDPEENRKIVDNFYEDANVTSPSPVTVAKKVVKEIANAVGKAIEWLKDRFGWGDDDGGTETLDGDDIRAMYKEIFPSKDDVINSLNSLGDDGINVASYLLRDKTFEKNVWMVRGNAANTFSEKGLGGWLTSFSNTVVWASGIIDTGLVGLKVLYETTYYVCITMREANNGAGYITSAKQYEQIQQSLIENINAASSIEDKDEKEKQEEINRLMLLYTNAYYKFIYEGDDKYDGKVRGVMSNLGNYFRENSYYIDVDNGDWSPRSMDVITSILYCVLVVQSVMFLFAYMKRFFYVIILSVMGPVTVLYDYVMKSY